MDKVVPATDSRENKSTVFNPADVSCTDDWKAAYPRLINRVDERVFTQSAILDKAQSDSERHERLEQYPQDAHQHPKVLPDDPIRYRYSSVYTIPLALKLELLEAVSKTFIHPGTLNAPILRHSAADVDQKTQCRPSGMPLQGEPLENPCPPRKGMIVPHVSSTAADALLETLRLEREKDDNGCLIGLKAKRNFVSVEDTIETFGWQPRAEESTAMRPVLRNGGFQWREWEQETLNFLAAANDPESISRLSNVNFTGFTRS